MRQLFILTCLLALGLLVGDLALHRFIPAPCSRPVAYSVVSVDSRFPYSLAEVSDAADKAAKLWNQASGRSLFTAATGKHSVPIRLIYDDRQQKVEELKRLKADIDQKYGSVEQTLLQYKQQSAQYAADLKQLNDTILGWNDRGGAPPDVYAKLTAESQSLETERRKLNQMRTDGIEKANTLSDTIATYNENTGQAVRVGEYTGDTRRIDIYAVEDRDDLKMTIAHELGHALGLGHVSGDNALMSAQVTGRIPNITPTDLAALTEFCNQPVNYLRFLISYFNLPTPTSTTSG